MIYVLIKGCNLQRAVKYLGESVTLVFKDDVGSVLVFMSSPNPEDAQGRPQILINALNPVVKENCLYLLDGSGRTQELVHYRKNKLSILEEIISIYLVKGFVWRTCVRTSCERTKYHILFYTVLSTAARSGTAECEFLSYFNL